MSINTLSKVSTYWNVWTSMLDSPSSSVVTVTVSVNTPQPMALQTDTWKSYEVKGKIPSVTLYLEIADIKVTL